MAPCKQSQHLEHLQPEITYFSMKCGISTLISKENELRMYVFVCIYIDICIIVYDLYM